MASSSPTVATIVDPIGYPLKKPKHIPLIHMPNDQAPKHIARLGMVQGPPAEAPRAARGVGASVAFGGSAEALVKSGQVVIYGVLLSFLISLLEE
jgi:hypothetical protein